MQFKIPREKLLKLLKVVSGVVDRKQQQNPIMANVLLKAADNKLEVVGTDLEVELKGEGELHEILEPGEITVPFRKLLDVCKALPDSAEIFFQTQESKATIKSGRSRFVLSTLPADKFPDVQRLQRDVAVCELNLPVKTFKILIEKTAFAMAEQDVRYFLNGMLLEIRNNKLYTVAADGHRLAMNFTEINNENIKHVKVIVPRKGILEIMRMLDDGNGEINLIFSDSHLQLQIGSVMVTTKLLDGKFPDYERVIPTGGDKVIVGHREVLKEAFNRSAALFSEKFRAVKLKLSPTGLKLLATTNEKDEVEEDLEIEYSGQEMEVGFNVRYLIDYLSVINSESVRFTFSDSNKSALIEEVVENITGAYVLMPIRT